MPYTVEVYWPSGIRVITPATPIVVMAAQSCEEPRAIYNSESSLIPKWLASTPRSWLLVHNNGWVEAR